MLGIWNWNPLRVFFLLVPFDNLGISHGGGVCVPSTHRDEEVPGVVRLIRPLITHWFSPDLACHLTLVTPGRWTRLPSVQGTGGGLTGDRGKALRSMPVSSVGGAQSGSKTNGVIIGHTGTSDCLAGWSGSTRETERASKPLPHCVYDFLFLFHVSKVTGQ